jgi:hypothetical protein
MAAAFRGPPRLAEAAGDPGPAHRPPPGKPPVTNLGTGESQAGSARDPQDQERGAERHPAHWDCPEDPFRASAGEAYALLLRLLRPGGQALFDR